MLNKKIRKVLIANRGEIAIRIQKACKDLKLKSLLIVSQVDRYTVFARQADELYIAETNDPFDPYLNQEKIIEIAKKYNCDAIHPGYGFLSENYEFAAKVEKANLILIGPSAEIIKKLANKDSARNLMRKQKIPILPGSKPGLSKSEIIKIAEKISYPVLIKAAAGGGGRGIRLVEDASQIDQAIDSVQMESLRLFGSDQIFVEKYLPKARHIEVQVLGDQFGKLVHFGLRDCSIQRRRQKLLEESPAIISKKLEKSITAAALKLLKALKYTNAGTVEFLVEQNNFYCLEVNTRIQVEHRVTELAYGVDLVKWQIQIASGKKLSLSQKAIKAKQHAIQFRLFAEDPSNAFAPQAGAITKFFLPKDLGVQIDNSYSENDIITSNYDAMLAKIIISAKTRNEVIVKARKFFAEVNISGITCNQEFFCWVLVQDQFFKCADINFVEREFNSEDFKLLDLPIDPKHQSGAEFIYPYYSNKFKKNYTIKIIHHPSGLFLAIPNQANLKNPKPEHCRFSNELETAKNSLINEVLESIKTQDIFIK